MMVPDASDREYLRRVLANARHVLCDDMPAKEREIKRDQLQTMLDFALDYVLGLRERSRDLQSLD